MKLTKMRSYSPLSTRTLILFLLAIMAFGCTKNKTEKPNIIFILTDDQRWDAMGYAGNQIIETPEMDKLASEGTYFQHTFVTTPICAASRASILTGLTERTHGYTFQQGPLKKPYMDLAYPLQLQKNGYYTGFFGKLGVDCIGDSILFDQMDVYDRNGKYKDYRGYFYKTIDGDTVHLTQYTSYQAQEFIKNAPSDKPFCLSLSFSAPHAHDSAPDQYFWQEKSNKRYADITIPDPPLADEKYFNALPKEVREGFNRVRWHWRYDTPEKYQHSMKGYYRMISEVDDEIGQIRSLLQQKGIADNTVIIFMGDNGYFEGERQLAGKWMMYENSLRVPMAIYDPRVKNHHDVKDMVLNIDIPLTILDLAGVEVPKEYQGRSLIPYVDQGTDPNGKREIALFEHLWKLPQIPASEAVRTDKWKYFRYKYITAEEELYDLEQDSLEINNLSGDPEHQAILKVLRQKCDSIAEVYTKAKLISDYTSPELINTNF